MKRIIVALLTLVCVGCGPAKDQLKQPPTLTMPAHRPALSSSSGAVFTHTISGTNPTVVINSSTVAALDTNYLSMGSGVKAILLPPSTAIADGEVITVIVTQPGNSTAVLPNGQSSSPFTAGAGTSIINTVPGGCPNIGTGQLIFSLVYEGASSKYLLLGCQTYPAQMGVIESSLSSGVGTFGANAQYAVLASTQTVNPGHIRSISVSTLTPGSGCATPPKFLPFAGSVNGTIVTASAKENYQDGAVTIGENLPFNANKNIGILLVTPASGCATAQFVVTLQYTEP